MALQGTFIADFSSFYAAVQQAEVSLKSFDAGANKVENSLNRMVDSFSGRKIISEATLMAEAIERGGGVTRLTANELQRAGNTAAEAAAKMRALGIDVPPGLQKIVDAAKKIPPELTLADKAAGLLKSTFGQFTLAGLATMAISKLSSGVMEFVDIGTRLPAVEASFVRLNLAAGQSSNEMLATMTANTKGMVSNYDLMLSANKALLLGIPVTTESMGELSKTATILGRAMGKDATSSLNDMITALGRSSPMILDNLGLTVKVGEANEAYAAKLGKTSEQLTDAEKKTAFYEAAMEAARKKTAELGEQTLTLGEIAQTVWTKFGNVVSSTAATVNVGIGAALSDVRNFAKFLQDSVQMGVTMATQMAAARAQMDQLAGANQKVGESAPVAPMEAYRQKLDDLKVAAQSLTPEQQAMVRDALALGESASTIATGMDVSATAVKVYEESLKKLKTEQEKMTAAQAEMESAGKGWRGTLEGINSEVFVAVRGYLDAGVAQSALATAYNLTATQVRAIASALQDESRQAKEAEEANKKLHQARVKAIEEASGLWNEYYTTLRDRDLSAHNELNAQVELWKQKQIFAAVEAGIYTEEYYQKITAAANQMTQSQLVNIEELRTHSRTYAEEQAAQAEATYQYVLAHSQEFTSQFIELKRMEADEARRAAESWGESYTTTMDSIQRKAIETAEVITAGARQASLTWSEAMTLVAQGKGTMTMTIVHQPPPSIPFGREMGGPVSAGMPYIVGEKRPELFVPKTSGTILPFVPSGGSTFAPNITINAGMGSNPQAIARAVKQALVDAARAQGQHLGIGRS